MNFYKFLLSFATLFAISNVFAASKNLNVPEFTNVKINLDGKVSESFWKNSAKFTQKDMVVFRKNTLPVAKTNVYLCADKNNIYIAIVGEEKENIKLPGKIDSLWSREYIELFFGLAGENDWYRQIAFSLGGHRYTEFLKESDYKVKTFASNRNWSCEVILPKAKLGKLDNNSIKFNLLRRSRSALELQTWSNISWGHDVDKFGKLTFVKSLNEINHGPWTFDVTDNSCGFAWNSKGKKFTFGIKKFTDKKFTILPVVGKDDIHHVVAKNLEPNTVYQYKLNDNPIKTIKTLYKEPTDFSFSFTTDIHCRAHSLAKLLTYQDVKNSDMIFCLGDMVTAIVGRNTLYEALLDVFSTQWNKPFYYIRGNHEHRGLRDYYFDAVSPAKRQSFATFLHKGVYFVVLDTDGDFEIPKKYMDTQIEQLKKAVNSKEFANADFRVLLAHKPLFPKNIGGGVQINKIFSSLPEKIQKSFDLSLSGHVHSYRKTMPNSKTVFSTHPRVNGTVLTDPAKSFPVLTNQTDGVFVIKKTSKNMETLVFDNTGKVVDKVIVKRK